MASKSMVILPCIPGAATKAGADRLSNNSAQSTVLDSEMPYSFDSSLPQSGQSGVSSRQNVLLTSSEETARGVEVTAPSQKRPAGHRRPAPNVVARDAPADRMSMTSVHDAIKSVDSKVAVACLSNRRETMIDGMTNLMEAASDEISALTNSGITFVLVEEGETCFRAVVEILKRYSSSFGGIVLPVLMEQFAIADRSTMCKKISTLVTSGAADVVVLPGDLAELSKTISVSMAKGIAHRRVTVDFEKQLRLASKQCDELFWRVAHEVLPDFPEERLNMQEIPEKRVGNLALVEKLGEGAFGAVYTCQNVGSGETCAIKVFPKASVKSHRHIQQISTEFMALKRMKHPNVITGLNFVHGVNNLYLLMELAGPRNLFKVMCRQREMPWPQVKSFLLQIAAGVAHMHEEGIAHCDLKPENMSVCQDGVLKIVDFGQAVDVAEEVPELKMPRGTMPFIPPEVMSLSTQWDPIGCDLWQVGVVLFEMLCGNDSFAQFMGWKGLDLMNVSLLTERSEEVTLRFDEAAKSTTLQEISSLCKAAPPSIAIEVLADSLVLTPSKRLQAKSVAPRLASSEDA